MGFFWSRGRQSRFHPLFFLPVVFRWSWHTGLYKFKVCNALIWFIYVSNDYFNKFSEKPLYHTVSSIAQLCLTVCDTMDCSMPGLPVHQQLPEFTQTHDHWVGDAIQPSHPLSPPSPPAFNSFQHQGLFKRVSSSHQMAKVLELQHQSFQWTPRTDFL